MDEFVEFAYGIHDASPGSAPGPVVTLRPRRERVDVVARQFHDFLRDGDVADDADRGFMLTHDFRLRRQVYGNAGWLSFVAEQGTPSKLGDVALVVFARSSGADAERALERLRPYGSLQAIPSGPFAVVVRLVPKVPSIVDEWLPKAAAGFLAKDL